MFKGDLLDGIVIFVEVVNCKSFTAAAIKSNHSTSYISKMINQLEQRLGIRLLHRTTRSLSLTPEGELYFQQCQQIIQDAENTESLLSGGQVEPTGTLRISCPVSFGLSRIRPILATFTEMYPKINLDLDLNDREVDMVADGFDILIRASNQLDESSLISRRILLSHFVTIASPSYLSQHGMPKKPADLTHHKTITYSYMKQPNLWPYAKNIVSKNIISKKSTDEKSTHKKNLAEDKTIELVPLNSRVITNSPEMELALCLAGQGITRLPSFNLNGEIESGKLVELFADLPKQTIGVYLLYPSRKHMSSKVRSFIDFIMDEIGNHSS